MKTCNIKSVAKMMNIRDLESLEENIGGCYLNRNAVSVYKHTDPDFVVFVVVDSNLNPVIGYQFGPSKMLPFYAIVKVDEYHSKWRNKDNAALTEEALIRTDFWRAPEPHHPLDNWH